MAAPANKRSRKKAAPVVEAAEPVEIVPPRPNRVSLADLWEMRLAQLEKRALLAEAEVSRMTKMYALEKLDKKGIVLALEKKMSAAQRLADAADTKAKLAKQRMESTIGRKLANVSIDPDTGEIVNSEE